MHLAGWLMAIARVSCQMHRPGLTDKTFERLSAALSVCAGLEVGAFEAKSVESGLKNPKTLFQSTFSRLCPRSADFQSGVDQRHDQKDGSVNQASSLQLDYAERLLMCKSRNSILIKNGLNID